jgi:hypothetical protein
MPDDENPDDETTGEEKADTSKASDAAERWQKATRDQLGSTVKLVLTLTTGTIAFAVHIGVRSESAQPTTSSPTLWAQGSILALLVAAAIGIVINLTRLLDFRWTARTVRIRTIRDKIKSLQKSKEDAVAGIEKPRWLEDLPEPLKKTAKIETSPEAVSWQQIIDHCRGNAYRFGKLTWRLMPFQFVFFFVGIALLSMGLLFKD